MKGKSQGVLNQCFWFSLEGNVNKHKTVYQINPAHKQPSNPQKSSNKKNRKQVNKMKPAKQSCVLFWMIHTVCNQPTMTVFFPD